MPAHVYGWRSRPPARRGPRQCSPPRCSHPILPLAGMIASAISRAVQRLGTRGCAEKMAQEWGSPGCGGRADALGAPARRLAVHAQTACTARRTGRPVDQAPERLASTRRRHARPWPSSRRRSWWSCSTRPSCNTRPPNQKSNEQSDVHLEQRPRHPSCCARHRRARSPWCARGRCLPTHRRSCRERTHLPRLDRPRTAVLGAWRGFAVWCVRSAVSVAGLAGFEVTGGARAAWVGGRGCGRGCWPGLRRCGGGPAGPPPSSRSLARRPSDL